tara:strand:+ start:56 stop:727 length:672 start_codon:yes stop_codon:yes gene_type:complete
MAKNKINCINYYILMSLLVHFCVFMFIGKKNGNTLGEQTIPIEVFDNLVELGVGEATKRSKSVTKKNSLKNKTNQNPLGQMKSFEESTVDKNVKNEKVEQKKSKINNINQTILKEEKGSGSREGIENNEPEKGSLRGIGRIKVTCLKCVRPIYPPVALRRGVEGKATIKIWINSNGKVTKAEVINKSGSDIIDNASLKAARTSSFYPLDQNTVVDIEYNLKIK